MGTNYVSKSGGNEAYIQNQAGNFENATVANIKAAIDGGPFVKSNQTSEIPPGFPYIKNAYIPLPSAATAAPFVSYDFGYFYSCYPERQLNQVNGIHEIYKWGLTKQDGNGLTPADTILEANALVELPDKAPKTGGAAKNTSQSAIAGLGVTPTSHSGSYIDPTTGNTLPYSAAASITRRDRTVKRPSRSEGLSRARSRRLRRPLRARPASAADVPQTPRGEAI